MTIKNESAVVRLGTVAVARAGLTSSALGTPMQLVDESNTPASGVDSSTSIFKKVKALVASFADIADTETKTTGGKLNLIIWL